MYTLYYEVTGGIGGNEFYHSMLGASCKLEILKKSLPIRYACITKDGDKVDEFFG